LSQFSLSGKNALVTGATRGLGYEIAKLLAFAGAHVWMNGRSDETLKTGAENIRADGGQVSTLPFDISDLKAAELAINKAGEENGSFDILVNNVGIRNRRGLFEFNEAEVQQLVNVNLISAFHISRIVAEQMIKRGNGGRIVNISSIAGPIARSGDAVYTMAKAGIDGLTRALAAELGVNDITVNGVAPGYFKTDANEEAAADPAVSDWLKKRTSLGRWGEPDRKSVV